MSVTSWLDESPRAVPAGMLLVSRICVSHALGLSRLSCLLYVSSNRCEFKRLKACPVKESVPYLVAQATLAGDIPIGVIPISNIACLDRDALLKTP